MNKKAWPLALALLSLASCTLSFNVDPSSKNRDETSCDLEESKEGETSSERSDASSSEGIIDSKENVPSSFSEESSQGKNVFYDGGFLEGGESDSSANPGACYLWYGYNCGGEVSSKSSSEDEYRISYKASLNWWAVQLFYQAPYAEKGEVLTISTSFYSDVEGKITVNGEAVALKANSYTPYEKTITTSANSQGYLSTFSIQLGVDGIGFLKGGVFAMKKPSIRSEDAYHTVSFLDKGKTLKEIEVKEGKTVAPPPSPEPDSGYSFSGWEDNGVIYSSSLAITRPHSFSSVYKQGESTISSYVPEGYSLVWNDEFNGDSLSSSNWSCQVGNGYEYGIWEWGNAEKQYYKEENACVSDGALRITAKKETTTYGSTTYRYSSARLRSYNKVHYHYGYIEARIKMPLGTGVWPAFWMLPESTYNGNGWPHSGEIDIMECRGRLSNQSTSALHYSADGSSNDAYQTGTNSSFGSIDSYHCYGLLWTQDSIAFMVDGMTHLTVKSSTWLGGYGGGDPFSQDFHILFNLAIGGKFDEGREPDSSFSSAEMSVDYVRWYQA